MANTTNSIPCPKTGRLVELINTISTEIKEITTESNGESDTVILDISVARETLVALRWTHNWLSARAGYQRKQQLKKQIFAKLIKEQGLMPEVEDALKTDYADELESMNGTEPTDDDGN